MGYNSPKKMKRLLFLIIVTVCSLAITSCSDRNSPNNPRETTNNNDIKYGYIQVINNSSSPYAITIKGNTPLAFTLNGQQSITKKVEVGYYNVHVQQQSGYLLYPTEHDFEGYVKENKTSIISFTTTL